MIDISIVIPAYNEDERIVTTINLLYSRLETLYRDNHEVIIVDDGSRDATSRLCRDLCEQYNTLKVITLKNNKGKGYAVRRGILESEGEYVLFMDADGSTSIDDVMAMINSRRDEVIIIASRAILHAHITRPQSRIRSFLGRCGLRLIRSIHLLPIYDSQCGCKLFRRDVAFILFSDLKTNRWLFDVEILRKAYKAGYVVKQWPVRWKDMPGSKVTLWGYITSLWELMWISIRN